MTYLYYKAINWNESENHLDYAVWEKLTSLFWLDTRIPVSNEKIEWNDLPEKEIEAFKKSLASLAATATFQSEKSYKVLEGIKPTQQEIAIFNNLQFIESVHAKAYNTILIEFEEEQKVDAVLEWVDYCEEIQFKLDRITNIYSTGSVLQKRAAQLLLEGVLNYSGLFVPLFYGTQQRFSNVSEMINNVLKNELLHCYYISQKFKIEFNKLNEQRQEELKQWVFTLFTDLITNELRYINQVYKETDWLEEVTDLIKSQGNQVLNNLDLGYLFAENQGNSRSALIRQLILQSDVEKEMTYPSSVSSDNQTESDMAEEDYFY